MASGRSPRWLLTYWLSGLVVLAATGAWLVTVLDRQLISEETARLDAIATLKVGQIAAWRAELLADATVLMGSPTFVETVQRWLVEPNAEDAALLLGRFRAQASVQAYGDVSLVEASGRVRLRLSGRDEPLHPDALTALSDALARGAPALSELHLDGHGTPHLGVVAPLPAVEGKPAGAVVLQCDASRFLFPLVQRWPVPSRTAETLLVRRDGGGVLVLNELRHRSGTALRLRLPLADVRLPAARGAAGEQGAAHGVDYRGVRVLAVTRAVPASNWVMVAKVDRAEAFVGVRRSTRLVVGLLVALAAAGTASAAAVWQRGLKAEYRRRLRIQEQLQASEARYAVTLLAIGDAIISTDRGGRVDVLNPVAERLTGWTQEEARGRPLSEVFRIVNEETREPVEDPVARVLREGRVVGLANHTLLLARDGREVPIADSGAPIRGAAGAIVGVVLDFRDQTEERTARRVLRESEAKYRALVEQAHAGVWSIDAAGSTTYVNARMAEMLGYSVDEMAGAHLFSFLDEAGRAAAAENLERRRRGVAEKHDFEFVRRDGTRLLAELSTTPLMDENGTYLGASAVVTDITERRRAEEALRAEKAWSEAIVASAPNIVVGLGERSRIIVFNAFAERLTGYRAEEVMGKPWIELFIPEPLRATLYGVWDEIVRGRLIEHHFENEILTKGGGTRIVSWSNTLLESAGDFSMVLSVGEDVTERRRAEAALRESEERHRLVVENASDLILVAQDGVITFANARSVDFVGRAPEEVAGRPITEYVHPEDRALVADRYARRMRGESIPETYSFRVLGPRGGVKWVEINAVRIEWGGKPATLNFLTDVTERRKAEEALRESEETFAKAFETSPYAIILTRAADGAVVAVNQGFTAMTGHQREEALGSTTLALGLWDDPRDRDEVVASLRAGRRVEGRETRFRRKDGRVITGLYYGSLIKQAGEECVVSSVSDITERKRAEEALSESEQRYRNIVENVQDAFYEVALDGTILEISPSIAAISRGRFTRESLLGRAMSEFYADPSERGRLLDALRERGSVTDHEIAFLGPGGEAVPCSISARLQPGPGGTPERIIGTLRDISARRRLEQQLLQAQKMEAIGTLAGGIAHDFNNLLQALLATVQVARLKSGDGGFRNTFEELEALVRRGADLARQLLLFARQEPTRRTAVDLSALLREQAGMLRRLLPENIEVRVDAPGAGLVVDGDPTQLRQVLTNLAVNARDAMPEGGALTLAGVRRGGVFAVQVRDTGVGMSEEVRQRIFDPFFSTKAPGKGTGLGLAVVWGIVEQHGGRISVESVPGGGTSFEIVLPPGEVQGEVCADAANREAELPCGRGERVLVVEDEEGARAALVQMLEMLGYGVRAVGCAEEAGRLPSEPGFDVLLTDYLLPGASGIELARGLTQRWPNLRVVVMSGYAPDDVARALFAAGPAYYLGKPFDMAGLAQALRAALGGSTFAEQQDRFH
ncbi:MAG: PAS domain S-box protein [Acidobacteriota bacterium]